MVSDKKKLFVILGMHRSGTSLITSSLQYLDIDLGHAFLEAQDDNPAGFFEDVDINQLNIEMLKALGKDWDSFTPISEADIQALHEKGYLAKAADLLKSKMQPSDAFGVKDPRITQLLAFWQQVFEQCQIGVQYIIALRNPISVADSLRKRNQFADEKSYALWLEATVNSIQLTQDDKRIVVDYDHLFLNAVDELKRVANHFSLAINEQQLSLFAQERMQPELRHSSYSRQDMLEHPACPEIVKSLYFHLFDSTYSNQSTPLDTRRWQTLLVDAHLHLRLLDLQQQALRDQAQQQYQLEVERENQQAKINELQVHIDNLDKSIEQREQTIANLQQEIEHIIAERNEIVNSYINSTSWKITRPLRAVVEKLNTLKN